MYLRTSQESRVERTSSCFLSTLDSYLSTENARNPQSKGRRVPLRGATFVRRPLAGHGLGGCAGVDSRATLRSLTGAPVRFYSGHRPFLPAARGSSRDRGLSAGLAPGVRSLGRPLGPYLAPSMPAGGTVGRVGRTVNDRAIGSPRC